jgi:hypothetical protein
MGMTRSSASLHHRSLYYILKREDCIVDTLVEQKVSSQMIVRTITFKLKAIQSLARSKHCSSFSVPSVLSIQQTNSIPLKHISKVHILLIRQILKRMNIALIIRLSHARRSRSITLLVQAEQVEAQEDDDEQ